MWRILALVGRNHLRNQISKSVVEKDLAISFVDSVQDAVSKLNDETYHLVIAENEALGGQIEEIIGAINNSTVKSFLKLHHV